MDFVWHTYSCNVNEWKIENYSDMIITNVEGQHLPHQTNDNVLTVQIENIHEMLFITNDLFSKFQYLRNIVIHSTSLKTILRGDFTLAHNLMNVHITHNNDVTILEDYCFHGAVMLKTLNLRENKIKDVSESAFKGLTALKFLTLTANVIETLHANTFVDQTYVEQISLSSNRLRDIHPHLFNKNRNLQVVFLDNNQLTYVNGKMFRNNMKLREIYMDNNRIKYIGHVHDFLTYLNHLEVAVFSNNSCVDAMLFIMNDLHPIYADIFKKC
jgi:hypothetical protein